jgi:sugar (pentulose or hexulose) kinase
MIAGAMQPGVDRVAVQRIINQRTFVLPAFAPAGPCGSRRGRVVPPTSDKTELAAAAMLYVALMTDLCLDQIRSTNAIMMDGGLVAGGVMAELIAQLRPNQAVSVGGIIEGTAAGAAALAFAAHGVQLELPQPHPVSASTFQGLSDYRRQWRAQLAEVNEVETEVPV